MIGGCLPALRVLFALLTVVTVIVAMAAGPATGADRTLRVSPTQELAKLITWHQIFVAPHGAPSRAGKIGATRPLTGGSTILPVINRVTTPDGQRWLEVMLPGRPNGLKGWITRLGTVLSATGWHVVVMTASRRVLVYDRGRLVRSFAAIVGKPATPTPRGRFFVEESILMPIGSAGAPFALALSARSNVLQEFEGGPGQIALHGLDNLGGTLGTAVSHGCVRLADSAVTWLAQRMGPGVPVAIL